MDVTLLKNTQEVFCYGEIQLKLLSAEDLPFTLQWRNEFREWFNTTNTVLFADHSRWYQSYLLKKTSKGIVLANRQFIILIGKKRPVSLGVS
jgi:diamine N-acetyltransferase